MTTDKPSMVAINAHSATSLSVFFAMRGYVIVGYAPIKMESIARRPIEPILGSHLSLSEAVARVEHDFLHGLGVGHPLRMPLDDA